MTLPPHDLTLEALVALAHAGGPATMYRKLGLLEPSVARTMSYEELMVGTPEAVTVIVRYPVNPLSQVRVREARALAAVTAAALALEDLGREVPPGLAAISVRALLGGHVERLLIVGAL